MRPLCTAVMIVAAAVSPALADDVACDDATYLLDTIGDLLVDIEYVKAGVRDAEDILEGAESVVRYGDDALARTTDEGWPVDYLESLIKLTGLSGGLASRGGVLDDDDATIIRQHGAVLTTFTAERCDADDIPVFIEPGGLACEAVVGYLDTLAEQLPVLGTEGSSIKALMLQRDAGDALDAMRAAGWQAGTIEAFEPTINAVGAIRSDGPSVVPKSIAKIMTGASAVAADARTICTTDTIPDLPAGI